MHSLGAYSILFLSCVVDLVVPIINDHYPYNEINIGHGPKGIRSDDLCIEACSIDLPAKLFRMM